MGVIIERAKIADAAAMIEHLRQVGAETDNLSFGAEGLGITAEAEENYIAQMENSRDGVMFVARDQDRIIGSASLNRLPRRMGHRGDFSIAVAREYWNRGVGGRLLRAAIDFARENGFEIIDLQVRNDNLAAIHLYEKHGFRKICAYPAFFKIEGRGVDFDFMRLELR